MKIFIIIFLTKKIQFFLNHLNYYQEENINKINNNIFH